MARPSKISGAVQLSVLAAGASGVEVKIEARTTNVEAKIEAGKDGVVLAYPGIHDHTVQRHWAEE